jgi:outer membrane receptor protein involved in Fe transport
MIAHGSKPVMHIGVCVLALAIAAGGGTVARAADSTGSTGGGLEQVTVTARKRSERLQKVPAAITVITAAQIKRYDLASIENIAAQTPNLSVGRSSNGSGAQLTLRGVGSSSTSIGLEQSVATVLDGVYFGQGRVIDEGFFDLSRIEVLKGPQALFFGKNATAGVLSFTSADPTSKPEYSIKAGYEFGSEQAIGEAIASLPLTDTLGLRIALRGTDMFGGYYKNDATPQPYDVTDVATGNKINTEAQPAPKKEPGENQFLGRLTLKYKPTDDFTATLKVSGDNQYFNNSSWNYVDYDCVNGHSFLNPSIACGRNFTIHQDNLPSAIAKNLPFAGDGQTYNQYDSTSGTLTLNEALHDVTLTSITNYNYNTNFFLCACDFQTSPTGTWATEHTTFGAFSEEARAATTFDGPLNALVGVYYQNTRRDFLQYVLTGNVANTAASPADEFVASTKLSGTHDETISPFVQATWKIIPTVELSGGARFTDETKNSFFSQPYVNPAFQSVFTPASSTDPAHPGVIDAHQNFTDYSPEATLSWTPIPVLTAFAAFKTGYKSGGFSDSGINSALSPNPAKDFQFGPETARGFEAGLKSDLLDHRLRLNLDLYRYNYHNLQIDFFNSPTFDFITTNAGSARVQGVELEGQYAPALLQGLVLSGTVNYNDAHYGDVDFPCYAGETPAEGCNPTTLRQNIIGTALSLAPKWTASFGGDYQVTMANFIVDFSTQLRYSDSYLASGFGDPYSRQAAYATIDAAISASTVDDRWKIALIGKNLSNQFYVAGVVDGPSTGSGTGTPNGVHADQLGFGNIPRTVTLEITRHF